MDRKVILKSANRNRVMFAPWQGAAICPGSCGELVQGTWNGINFLVPCPINLFSTARVTLWPNSAIDGPPGLAKARLAMRKTLDSLGYPELGGVLTIESKVPQGKGMASSTADIGATIAATAHALGIALKPSKLAQLAVSIEPTDGTLLPGLTLLDHVKGSWILPLGIGPKAKVLGVDLGGQIDTVEFNSSQQLANLNCANEPITKQAFHLVRRGIQAKDLDLIGRGATLSAEANQTILWKPILAELLRWGKSRGSTGIVAAHSGTVLGLLYPPQVNLQREALALKPEFPEVFDVWQAELVSGGVKPLSAGETGQEGWYEDCRC